MQTLFSDDHKYRYTLYKKVSFFGPVCTFIMLNPSTADAHIDDPTIRRCKTFTLQAKCCGLLVMNLFALRSTNPALLYSHTNPVGPDNDRHIRVGLAELIGKNLLGPVVCAWGSHPAVKDIGERDKAILDIIHHFNIKPVCLGTTTKGFPKHPLYVANATEFVPFKTSRFLL